MKRFKFLLVVFAFSIIATIAGRAQTVQVNKDSELVIDQSSGKAKVILKAYSTKKAIKLITSQIKSKSGNVIYFHGEILVQVVYENKIYSIIKPDEFIDPLLQTTKIADVRKWVENKLKQELNIE